MSDPIAQVFATPPADLTPDKLRQVIDHYREARKNFDLGDKKAGSSKPKKPSIEVELELGLK